MKRKKVARHASRKQHIDFRIRLRHLVFVFFAALLIVLLNPVPADLTPQNVYQKTANFVLHKEQELISQAYIDSILVQDGSYKNEQLASIFDNNPVPSMYTFPATTAIASVLPANTEAHVLAAADEKWIEVDLSEQKLYAWENGNKVYEFLVSSGKPWWPTLTGEFRIWIKLRYARMQGGSVEGGDYYDVKNVPYVMYYDRGYGLHGAYWHNNFGHPMSHGCVNIKPDEAGLLYEWAGPDMQGKTIIKSTDDNPGTRVVIHD